MSFFCERYRKDSTTSKITSKKNNKTKMVGKTIFTFTRKHIYIYMRRVFMKIKKGSLNRTFRRTENFNNNKTDDLHQRKKNFIKIKKDII